MLVDVVDDEGVFGVCSSSGSGSGVGSSSGSGSGVGSSSGSGSGVGSGPGPSGSSPSSWTSEKEQQH